MITLGIIRAKKSNLTRLQTVSVRKIFLRRTDGVIKLINIFARTCNQAISIIRYIVVVRILLSCKIAQGRRRRRLLEVLKVVLYHDHYYLLCIRTTTMCTGTMVNVLNRIIYYNMHVHARTARRNIIDMVGPLICGLYLLARPFHYYFF